jgi:hypothetical protein
MGWVGSVLDRRAAERDRSVDVLGVARMSEPGGE